MLQINKEKPKVDNMGTNWPWKLWDLEQLCPRISLHTVSKDLQKGRCKASTRMCFQVCHEEAPVKCKQATYINLLVENVFFFSLSLSFSYLCKSMYGFSSRAWGQWMSGKNFRATSPTWLRADDQYTSSTLIGGKGRASPSLLLHTTLEGPTEYVNARWI